MNSNTDYLKLKAKYEIDFFKCLQPLCFAKFEDTGYVKYTRQEMEFYFEHVRVEGRDGNHFVNVSFFDIWCKDPNIRVCEKLPSLQPVQPVQQKHESDDVYIVFESESNKKEEKPIVASNSNPLYTMNLFCDDGESEPTKSTKKSKRTKEIVKEKDEVDAVEEIGLVDEDGNATSFVAAILKGKNKSK